MVDFRQLREQNYTHVSSCGVAHALLSVSMNAFATLVRYTPPEVLRATQKEKLEKNSTPLGYTRRDGKGGNPDIKHYLHFTREWSEHSDIATLAMRQLHLKFFLGCARQLSTAVTPIATALIHDFDQQFPDAGFARTFLQKNGAPCLEFRFLAYDQLPPDRTQELARPHFDKSGFTLGLYESRPGLQVQRANGVMCDVPKKEGGFSLILGDAVQDLTQGAAGSARHQVTDTRGAMQYPPTPLTPTGIARTALVCFIDPMPGTIPIRDKETLHRVVV